MKKYSTIIGTLMSFGLIYYGMGGLDGFVDMPSVYIVIGGTIGTTLMIYDFEKFKSLIKILKVAFMRTDLDRVEEIYQVYNYASKGRRNGILSLEDDVKSIEDVYLRKGLELVIDGTESDIVNAILDKEMEAAMQRHSYAQSMLSFMAEAAPAFGMIGTLVGLVGMLQNLADSAAIGPNMAVALLTTFYGAVLANVVFIPLNNKLEKLSEDEISVKTAILEGILSMQAGEAPSVTEDKLKAYLNPELKEIFNAKKVSP